MRIAPSTRRLKGQLRGNGRIAECVVVVRDDGNLSEVKYITEVSPPLPDGDYTLTVGYEQREGGHWRCQTGKWTLRAG